jgi:hypothetical protein
MVGTGNMRRVQVFHPKANPEKHGDLHKCAFNYQRSQCECLCAKKSGFKVHVGNAIHKHWGNQKNALAAFWKDVAGHSIWHK